MCKQNKFIKKAFKATLEKFLNLKIKFFWLALKCIDLCYAHSCALNCPGAPEILQFKTLVFTPF